MGPSDFAGLRGLIEARRLRSIDEVLPYLPIAYRSRYILMFDSRSLHGSSFRDPRVILYGADARFIVSFNGEPGQRGYPDLETMEYDAATREFAYREIHFPEPGDAASAVVISPANPKRCRTCHGTPARPLWDSFPVWPGAYGEHYLKKLSPAEAAGLLRFLDQQKSHPRYRTLVGAERLALEDTYSPTAATRYGATSLEPPNAEFSTLLGRLNIASLIGEIERAGEFNRWRFALLATLDTNCGRLNESVPPAARAAFTMPLDEFVARGTLANQRQYDLKAARVTTPDRRNLGAIEAESLDDFRYLVEQGLGLSTRAWTTALEKSTYDFAMPGGARAEFERQLLADLGGENQALKALAEARAVSSSERYCGELRRLSRAALATPALSTHGTASMPMGKDSGGLTQAAQDQRNTPATIAPCVLCHTTGIGPDLPFDQPDRLTEELMRPGYSHGSLLDEILFRLSPAAGARRMPLGTTLSSPERSVLEQFFRALAHAGNAAAVNQGRSALPKASEPPPPSPTHQTPEAHASGFQVATGADSVTGQTVGPPL